MQRIFLLILFIGVLNAGAQDWPVKKLVDAKRTTANFLPVKLLDFSADKPIPGRGIYQSLKLRSTEVRQLLLNRPEAITIILPVSQTETIRFDLVRASLGNIKFTENNTEELADVKIPVLYRGVVSGRGEKNTVVFTANETYISLIASLGDQTLQVTKGEETSPTSYRLYNSKFMNFPVINTECGTKNVVAAPAAMVLDGSQTNRVAAIQDKCVQVYVDCFNGLYNNKGNDAQQTINYVYELFNLVAAGYLNEQINIVVSGVNVWSSPDPFRGILRDTSLADLAAFYKDNFWGNICVGLDFSTGASGIAGAIGSVKGSVPNTCPAYSIASNPFCYNDLNYSVTVKNFPVGPNTTGPQLYLVMHEMGHLFGSRHTKWCGWKLSSNPDVYGPLDSCGVVENGPCAQGPPPPPSGATIMSYCVSAAGGAQVVNYNNGFGPLPGTAIRNFLANSVCVANCLECALRNRVRGLDQAADKLSAVPVALHSAAIPILFKKE